MGNYLSFLVQVLFLTCGPLLFFGVIASLCRTLFIWLVGRDRLGQRVLLCTLAPTTPLRVLGNAIMAILFGERITDICFLNVRDPYGELGFVERSYNPRNPIALLGNFFYALGPSLLGLLVCFAVLLACFGDALPSFVREVALLSEQGGDLLDYADLTRQMLPSLFTGEGASLVGKIVGCLLLLLLCSGVFVAVSELVESFSGLVLYVGLAGIFAAVLMLFDARVQRIVLSALHSFAALITALYLVLLSAMAALLLLGVLAFLYRFLFGSGGEEQHALVTYEEEYPDERR